MSPAFFDSPYCEWEFNEYLKHEFARSYGGTGLAPIYFVEMPGWDERIKRGERVDQRLGNVDQHNPGFMGRFSELRRLKEAVALGQVGVLTAVHGLGGMGKTALATEYPHGNAHEYGGGCWQVRCEGMADLRAAMATLATPLAIEFSDEEKRHAGRQLPDALQEAG